MKKIVRRHSLLGLLGVLSILVLSASTFGFSAQRAHRYHRTLQVDGESRRYLLYVPASYDASRAVPLVISIHGHSGWPANQEQVSGWDDLADQYGFIVAYPMGTGMPLHWRASGTADSYKDVDFISSLMDQVEADYKIDPSRVYVNGHSNGGGMTFMLTCALSQRIAAAGSVAGAYLYPWSQCQNDRPVPLIVFHGTADPIVPYTGGPSKSFDLPFPDVVTWVGEYAAHNGCTVQSALPTTTAEVSAVRYSGCKQNAEVDFYTIQGSGHGWPGSGSILPAFIVGKTSDAVDATAVMWNFFNTYSLK